jgi:predicted dehydrogenase
MPTEVSQLFHDARVAFVGGGFMTSVHARAARAAGGQLVGVASRTESSAEEARSAVGAQVAYRSVDELLADERVNVVHICSPNQTHASITRAALAAGKHVICEKPLATSVADAADLARFASNFTVVAAVPFVYRFHPMVREARARVRRGQSGRIFSIHGAYLQDWLHSTTDDDWRVDPRHGGPSRAFADIGSHLCDLIEFVTGDQIQRLVSRVRTVHADRETNKNVSTEDVVTVVFETARGVIGTLHVSQVAAGHKNGLSIEIAAENESLNFRQEAPDYLRLGTKAGFLDSVRSDALSAEVARYSIVPAGHPQGYQDAFNAFVSDAYTGIRGTAPDGLPTFDDGLRAAVLTEAVLRSHDTGQWVETISHSSPSESLPDSTQLAHRGTTR